jgi:hypothetical protein
MDRNSKSSPKPFVPLANARHGLDGSLHLKGEKRTAGSAVFSSAGGLQEAALSFLGAIGANVMLRLPPLILRLEGKYKGSRPGLERLVSAIQFRAAIHVHHLAFKVAKSAKQRQLRNLSIDELLLELERKFGHLGGGDATLIGALNKVPELLDQISSTADEVDRRLSAFKKSIHIHPTRPLANPPGQSGPDFPN